jgi:putative hydrolase of the HAD superfamily
MIKNIIFDLGNVLLKFKPEEFLLQFTSDKEYIKQFVTKITRSKLWLDLDRGYESLENAESIFLSKYPEEKKLISLFFNHWMEMLTPIEENISILLDLSESGYKTYILSNYIKEAFKFVKEKFDFFTVFDGQIISGEEKVIKPDKTIYESLLRRYQLIPDLRIFT